MMWIFEWDIVTGDSAVLDVIYDDQQATSSTRRSRAATGPLAAVAAHARRDRGDGCRDLA